MWVCYFSKKQLNKIRKYSLYTLVNSMQCLKLYLSSYLDILNLCISTFWALTYDLVNIIDQKIILEFIHLQEDSATSSENIWSFIWNVCSIDSIFFNCFPKKYKKLKNCKVLLVLKQRMMGECLIHVHFFLIYFICSDYKKLHLWVTRNERENYYS